jgi:F-type H+-transporting ATPase subunit delta
MAEKRGEITAEAVSAAPLSDEQVDVLRDAAVHATGKSVQMKLDVNPDLIGGVILKIGSRMIDASVRSKLAVLQQRMKEVG